MKSSYTVEIRKGIFVICYFLTSVSAGLVTVDIEATCSY